MKKQILKTPVFSVVLACMVLLMTSCAPQIQLSSSWTNKNITPKKQPRIMVMVIGKDLANRQLVEQHMVAEFQKNGQNAISSLDVFKPEVQKYDSATMVAKLREAKVDMLLTNAVVNVSEKETYVPGTTEQVPVGSYATPYNPYYSNNYGYNNYYNSNYYYQTMYETRTTPGYTYTDVEVIIESNLYDVSIPELLWFGQSKASTKEPSTELFSEFAKIVVSDIMKSNILSK